MPSDSIGSGPKRDMYLFACLRFFLDFGFSAGFFSIISLFVSRVGTFSLFYIYLCSSIFSFLTSYLFSKIVDRYSRRITFFATFLSSAGVLFLIWISVRLFPDSKALIFATRIFCFSIYIVSNLEFWTLTSLSFTHSDSKKVFSNLAIVTILGEMAGGVFTGLASKWLGTQNLLLIWFSALVLGVVLFLRFSFPRRETIGFSTGMIWGEVQAPGTGFRSRSFFASRFVQILFLFWVIYSFIGYGTDYVFNTFVSQKIANEDALTSFFGKLGAIASIIQLAYLLLIAPRLADRLKPAQNLLLLASLMTLPWIVFFFFPSLVTVAIMQGIVYYFSDQFSNRIHTTMLTVFPERVKGRIRAITEGYGIPLGAILIFLLAACYRFHLTPDQIRYWIIGVGLFFCFYPLIFQKPYRDHLLNCLQSRDASLVLNATHALVEIPQIDAIDRLTEILRDSKNLQLKRSALKAMWNVHHSQAMAVILPILVNPKDPLHADAIAGLKDYPDFQAIFALLGFIANQSDKEELSRSFQALKTSLGKEILVYLLGRLHEPDHEVKRQVLRTLSSFHDRRLITTFLSFLNSPDPKLRAEACIGLYPFARSREGVRRKAIDEISSLVNSEILEERLAGLEAVGCAGVLELEEKLKSALDDQDARVVCEASTGLALMKNPIFLSSFISLLLNEDEIVAGEAARKTQHFPKKSRQELIRKIAKLAEVEQVKIHRRLIKSNPELFPD